MPYEVKQDEMTQEKWDELQKVARDNFCAVCGAELQVHTNPDRGTVEVGCLNREHHGYVERTSLTQDFRRGLIVHPNIQAAIEKRMLPRDELGRAMQMLALRYPYAIQNPAQASLFLMDCMRLGLDPLISPAEAVPIPFKSRKGKEETVTIQMLITGDGWLSMAARGCPKEWNGPPRTMRLEEYLAAEYEPKGFKPERIAEFVTQTKKADSGDPDAWYYMAIGRSKTMTEDVAIGGYFTKTDYERARENKLPAATNPGNQARIRAIKKWVRQVYPECRQKMIDLTAEWYQRSEGVQAAKEFIDAEYQILDMPATEETSATTSGQGGEAGGQKEGAEVSSVKGVKTKKSTERAARPPVAPTPTPKEFEAFWHEVRTLQLPQEANTMLNVSNINEWLTKGYTLDLALAVLKLMAQGCVLKEAMEKAASATPPAPPVEEAKSQKNLLRDPASIKSFDALWAAIDKDFGLSKAQSLKELNVTSEFELTETAAECYRRIAAVWH